MKLNSFLDKRKRGIIYTTIKYKIKRGSSMNEVKKGVDSVFGLLMFPYYLL